MTEMTGRLWRKQPWRTEKSGGGRRDNDAVFTPELTKTSKDSKRERDRENKNKKKDFEKNSGGRSQQTEPGRKKQIFPESRKLFRNRLLSQNRKRRNQK